MKVWHPENFKFKPSTPTKTIITSFVMVIAAGTFLLALPWAGKAGGALPLVDALFTATSATCVTGLSPIDIGTRLTFFGQIVVMFLIQIGGLGTMTFSTFFLYIAGRGVSIREKDILDTTLAYSPEPKIGSLLSKILIIAFSIEGIGALVLWLGWLSVMPSGQGVYFSIFHSISAFCNAGFSLFPSNLEAFRGNVLVNLTIMGLIILGGLGFIVLLDIRRFLFRPNSKVGWISFHSKMVLTVTIILILGGTLLFFILESGNILKELPTAESIMASFFQAVTARTAGFNTVVIGNLASATCLVLIFLMFIGAAPGSTGGGVKVTTVGILVAALLSRFRGQGEPHVFNRSISDESVIRASAIVIGSIILVGLVFFCLLVTEDCPRPPDAATPHFLQILFECVSAFGTVGLSMGVTPHLTVLGKLYIVVLMFIGRVGPLTLAVALAKPRTGVNYHCVKSDIMIG